MSIRMLKSRLLVFSLVALVAWALIGLEKDRGDLTANEHSPLHNADAKDAESVNASSDNANEPRSWSSSDTAVSNQQIYVSDDLLQYVSFHPGEKDLIFNSIERDPWESVPNSGITQTFFTSFAVRRIAAAAQADLLCVIGMGRGGASIIEIWEVTTPEGAYFADRISSSIPIGLPSPASPLVTGVRGGTWTPPSSRIGQLSVIRTEVFRDTALGVVRDVAIDPERRYLMFLADSVLYRLDLEATASGIPEAVLNASAYEAIPRANSLFLWERETGERCLILEALSGGGHDGARALLTDSENDGIFEQGPLVLPIDVWSDSVLGDSDTWAKDFVHYYD